MKKAYGYSRVSGQGQVEGDGLIRQEKAIRDYAASNGIEVMEIYQEAGVSGTTESREALAKLMISLELNGQGVNTVIIERLDRLSRDLMIQESIVRDFKSKRLDIISTLEGPDLLSDDPTRKFIRQVFGAVSEYDKDMLVLKLRAARERMKIKTGHCEGRKPFLETDEGQKVLAEIKRLRRKPKGQPRMTYAAIAQAINRMGFKSSIGRPFNGRMIFDILKLVK
ncbi:MAG: recombinase family protein [Syntrophobacteraceae bacterium]